MAVTTAFRDLTPYFLYLLLTATIGPLLFGYHLAELNAPQEVVTCVKKSIGQSSSSPLILLHPRKDEGSNGALPQCIPMSALQFGVVSSFFTLGGFIGALVAGPLTANQGRLRAMQYTACFAVLGPAIEALAPSIAIMTIGRFLSGIGAGAATVIVPIFISEIAPPGQKGFFGSATQVMINVGILIAQLLGLYLSRGQLWRIILGVAGAIALAQIVALVLAGQESPKWLADNGKGTNARRALQRLRGHRANIDDEVAGWGIGTERDMEDEEETLLANEDRAHANAIDANDHDTGRGRQTDGAGESAGSTAKQAKQHTIGALAVLRHPDSRRAVLAVAMIMVAQQLCGINSIVMYGVGLLSGLLSANAAVLNVVVAALNIAVTAACAPLVDVLGRKPCLLLSMAGMGSSAVMLAVGIMRAIPVLSAVAVLAFVASFGLGLGPVPFILSSELVDSDAVGATQSWALAANWIATFVVAQFFPVVNQSLGKGQVYFIFAAFALVFGTFTAWWVPETKGKRDADEVWGRSGKVLDRED